MHGRQGLQRIVEPHLSGGRTCACPAASRRSPRGSRRGLLAPADRSAGAPARRPATRCGFERVVDLTRAMGQDFPSFDPGLSPVTETVATLARDGYNMRRWSLVEHSGTHLDAPIHYADDGASADRLDIEDLVVPLVVIDIAGKAQDDPDALLTPDDLLAFEAARGPIPPHACVALCSGWERFVDGARFRNADPQGVMHFPGFHPEAAGLLIERGAAGLAVDTLSLDRGMSRDFPVHCAWPPTGRWGLEAVANLATLPPVGATIVVGGPKIKGVTGGPARVLALV
ncbi:MAG TPA: cyclase family protein [Geminicoccaceae bacterium]|nr:cyclase family protein [Geminicoccaceae bacterium]